MPQVKKIVRAHDRLAVIHLDDGSFFEIRGDTEAIVTNRVAKISVGQDFRPVTNSLVLNGGGQAPLMFQPGRAPAGFENYREHAGQQMVMKHSPAAVLNQQQLAILNDPELQMSADEAARLLPPTMNFSGEIEHAGGGVMPSGDRYLPPQPPADYSGAAGGYSPALQFYLDRQLQNGGAGGIADDPELVTEGWTMPTMNFDPTGSKAQQQQQTQRQPSHSPSGDSELDAGGWMMPQMSFDPVGGKK